MKLVLQGACIHDFCLQHFPSETIVHAGHSTNNSGSINIATITLRNGTITSARDPRATVIPQTFKWKTVHTKHDTLYTSVTQYTCVTNAFVQESFRREAPEMLNLVLISLFYYHYMFWWRNSRHFLMFFALKNNYTDVVLEAESFAFRSAFRARDVPK